MWRALAVFLLEVAVITLAVCTRGYCSSGLPSDLPPQANYQQRIIESVEKPLHREGRGPSGRLSSLKLLGSPPHKEPSSVQHLTVPCGRSTFRTHRIVRGEPARRGQVPWQLALYKHGVQACGAALLTARVAVTAAHCVWTTARSKTTVQLQAGVLSLNDTANNTTNQLRTVDEVVVHPGWRKGSWANDIALLLVDKPFQLDEATVAPICLAALKSHSPGPVLVAGWGRVREGHPRQPHTLQYTVLEPFSDRRCKKRFPYAFSPLEMFCAYGSGGRDTCKGDSGGAAAELVKGAFVLRGLVSWGAGCARPHTPGVYTRVAPTYVEWIRQTVQQKATPEDMAQILSSSQPTSTVSPTTRIITTDDSQPSSIEAVSSNPSLNQTL